jgi:hypothetical protein
MNVMQWLRKLGIYRSGSCAGTYTSGKDRPIELQMDDVFDAKKDLVTRADFMASCPKCRKALKPDDRFCAGCGTPVAINEGCRRI